MALLWLSQLFFGLFEGARVCWTAESGGAALRSAASPPASLVPARHKEVESCQLSAVCKRIKFQATGGILLLNYSVHMKMQ